MIKVIGDEWQRLVEYLPVDFVHSFRNVNRTGMGSNLMDGTLVPLKQLWENIEKEGLHDPLILLIGLDNTIKLWSGNHRIQIFKNENIEYVPVVCKIRYTASLDFHNGMHCFDTDKIEQAAVQYYLEDDNKQDYYKCSKFLKNLNIQNG